MTLLTYSKHRNVKLERLGFELVSVDVPRGELVLKHPGASVTDFDIDYQPKIWVMMGWVISARTFAHSQTIDQTTGRTFLDNRELRKERLVFVRASEIEFTKAMYDSMIDKRPLYMKVRGGYIGKTSYTSIAEVTSPSGETLIKNTNRLMGVDIVTRKPLPIPDWYRERNHRSFHSPPKIFEKLKRPNAVQHKRMRVSWSDLDLNIHATWSTYVMMTINAASLLVKDGHLRHFRENKLRGLHKLQLQFLGESIEGDELDVYVWEETETHIMNSDVCKKGKSIFQGSFEFFKD
ncbi:hypothetical protein FSP39_003385 [Pinctada imbricata]|uniref:Acyl-ACP thioesterase n=1 Tax=Pinctada imbricata TaxID=66713 RepID=A0AA88YGP8_PINIB|nr:hypothetical protein FSP39_003385 [Pinctada imbricata]